MSTVLLLIHIMVALALVGVVLLQRSEGGALGIGGGGGGFMTGRSAGNAAPSHRHLFRLKQDAIGLNRILLYCGALGGCAGAS